MRVSIFVAAVLTLFAAPALAQEQRSVLSPGELSLGAEFFPEPFQTLLSNVDGVAGSVSPSAGFVIRYAASRDLAVLGTVGFFHRIQKGDDPATFYAIGGGLQYEAITSKLASVFFRGGLQFIPRPSGFDDDGEPEQDFGVRFYAGPGIEARLTEAFSLQFYTALLDLQIGGTSTDFDLAFIPAIGGYLYF
ncbi:MAG TPA: outer membrane beta-barrel protein [Vulgatibacter sp.]|nr:outer membrane beta-barrel protein [Vulgatibacter sp.]